MPGLCVVVCVAVDRRDDDSRPILGSCLLCVALANARGVIVGHDDQITVLLTQHASHRHQIACAVGYKDLRVRHFVDSCCSGEALSKINCGARLVAGADGPELAARSCSGMILFITVCADVLQR